MPENPQSTPVATTDERAPAVSDDAAQESTLEDLLKPPPDYKPLPKWNDPELRYAPRGADPDQPRVTPEEAWRKINTLVEKYDKGMCESYREQIDTLLVFAGLFSAVVTAFTVDSYKWLQDDPTETSADLMRQAVSLLSTLANQTVPAISPQGPSLPGSAVVRINIYWFLSLVLSLSAALVGIVCKQWLREYERDVSQSAKNALRVRQMKFEGLEHWRVGGVVTSVPLLLQIALAMFLIGISELLWHLHRAVAIAVTTVAGLTAGFYLSTALLPLLQYLCLSLRSRRKLPGELAAGAFTAPQCPYKSPQAWLILRLLQPSIDYVMRHSILYLPTYHASWISFDTIWAHRGDTILDAPTTTVRALAWAHRSLEENHLSAWIFLCAREEVRNLKGEWDSRQLGAGLEHLVPGGWEPFAYGSHLLWWMRPQEELLEYSRRRRLDINLSVELLLQRMAYSPFYAGHLSNMIDNIERTFPVLLLDNYLAVELIRSLEQLLSWYPAPGNIAGVSYLLAKTWRLVHRAPTSIVTLMPALCAILLRWLQKFPSDRYDTQRATAAYVVLDEVARLEGEQVRSNVGAREFRSSGHITALARFMLEKDPDLKADERVHWILDRLGLDTLYKDQAPQSQQLPAHEGTHSDKPPGTAPDVQATHPITEPETSLPHVVPGDSSSFDTRPSSLPAAVAIDIDTRETVPDTANAALAVTPPTPSAHSHAETLPPPAAHGYSSHIELIPPALPVHTEIDEPETVVVDTADVAVEPSTPTTHSQTRTLLPLVEPGNPKPIRTRGHPPHTEIDIEIRETVPDVADVAVAPSTPTTQPLPPLVAQSVTASIYVRRRPAQTELDIETREPVPDTAADVAVAHSTPTTQPQTETLPPLTALGYSSLISTRTPPHTEIDIEMRELETTRSSSPDELGTYHRDVPGRDS